MRPRLLVKVGGNDLEKEGFLPALAQAIASQTGNYDCALVHGGGRTIDEMLRKLDLAPSFIEGQRGNGPRYAGRDRNGAFRPGE